jgi:hypothetical protein
LFQQRSVSMNITLSREPENPLPMVYVDAASI